MSTANESLLVNGLAPLNRLLAPAIRLGLTSPLPLGIGFVLLEVTGRRSGVIRTVPLLCTDYVTSLAVSTVRDSSQWVKNLAATPLAHVWLRGRRRQVKASVFRSGQRLDGGQEPADLQQQAAVAFSDCAGITIALLRFQ